jgi:telomerase protein component 1
MNHFLSSPDDTYIPRSSVAVTAVAWAPDGSVAVSGNQAGELTLWQDAKAVVTAQVNCGHFSPFRM